MSQLPLDIMKLSADSVRALAIDAVAKANSGHTGTAMALADASVVLFSQHLKFDPAAPKWVDRDRFVLSCGHASMLVYSMLHLTGYELSIDDIKAFRQWDSLTPGHPESHLTAGVETTTGPLGQGISTAVGMALAEAHLAARYNRDGFDVVDHHTYVIASDGDVMEGVSHEACALAGHLGLGKLIVLYDDNKITIDGPTDISMSEDVGQRYAAYGWHVIQLEDGHNLTAINAAIELAKAETARPTIIVMRTRIGYLHPKEGTSKAHGALTNPDENATAKAAFGWAHGPFEVPDAVYDYMRGNDADHAAWNALFAEYAATHPALAAEFKRVMSGQLSDALADQYPTFGRDEKLATRAASGKVLAAITPAAPEMIGGSADLTGSNKTYVAGMVSVDEDMAGHYVNYGVREHGMGAVLNGLSLHGGLRPYGGTFLVFSDFMRGAVRLSALMEQPVVYVYSHDSIGLGEDGPTHQPIEHLMALRAMPNLAVFRPADGNETAQAWKFALEHKEGPTAIVLTRQKLSTLDGPTHDAARGGYVLVDAPDPQAIIIATGSEVEIAVAAQKQLAEAGVNVRVVSLPCWELFEAQSEAYRNIVLPADITARVSIEAGATLGWQKYIGLNGVAIGLDRFGASAPYQVLYEKLGISAERVVQAVQSLT